MVREDGPVRQDSGRSAHSGIVGTAREIPRAPVCGPRVLRRSSRTSIPLRLRSVWFARGLGSSASMGSADLEFPPLPQDPWVGSPFLFPAVGFSLRGVAAAPLLSDCRSPARANEFIKRWCRRVVRSRTKPMQKVAGMLRKHWPLIPNCFRTGRAFFSGAVKGMNHEATVALGNASGFRSHPSCELAPFHTLAVSLQHSPAQRSC